MVDYIDPRIGIPLAIFLWLVVIVLFLGQAFKQKLDDFFAHRRHIRREKNRRQKKYDDMFAYAKEDLARTQEIYNANRPRHAANVR